jgi:lambda family phage minor tail protein L
MTVVVANFAQVHPNPVLKSRLAFSQNLQNIGGQIEGAIPYLAELGACAFTGNAELDAWYKGGGASTPLPFITATYDGAGRAITMANTPPSVITSLAASLQAAGCMFGMQVTGWAPGYQATYGLEQRRHQANTSQIAASTDIVAKWLKASNWPTPVHVFLGNEWMRTMNDVQQGSGVNADGSVYAIAGETLTAYETRRRSAKDKSVTDQVSLWLGTFALSGTKGLGAFSTANPGPLLSGDQSTAGGRGTTAGLTARAAWWDAYDASIKNASQVTKATYAAANDFGNRGDKILGQDTTDFNGGDYPFWVTQGGPGLLKTEDEDGGGDGGAPASDTRMGPACEMLTMLLSDTARNSLAVRSWSYFIGAGDAFLTDAGGGNYTARHRMTAMRYWAKVPTRRVPMAGVNSAPAADSSQFALQGLLGVAGIDAGGQSAAILLWNEKATSETVDLSAVNLPARLSRLQPTHYYLDESSASGFVEVWGGGTLTMAPRTAHLFVWQAQQSLELRRGPLNDAERSPVFLSRIDTYKRPKEACAYYDQQRGVAYIITSETWAGSLATGATYTNAPDAVYLTHWCHNMDAPTAPFTVSVDYGGGPVTLASTTAGALAGGITKIDLTGNAPGGWASGSRQATISVATSGASTQQIEVWFSGTYAGALIVQGDDSPTFTQELLSLAPGSLVELFELDATGLGGSLMRFHNGTNGLSQSVVWQGNTYQPFPVEASGFEFSGKGQLPRPTLKVANVTGALGAVVRATGDLLGAKLTRKRTLAKYLDAVNFPGGVNPTADPAAALPDDVFFVDRKANENKVLIEFELAAAFDVAGVQLPRRPITQNVCTWKYRTNNMASGCSYTGTAYFDANDQPVGSAGLDVCGKRLSSCKARHGTAPLPFGGFPGAGLSR